MESKYELFPGVYSNNGQTEALDKIFEFLKSDEIVFTLRGRGGTGKSTIIKKAIEKYYGVLGGMAVSHKAKKVLGLSIGRDKVMTLASALCIKLDENTGLFSPDLYKRKDPSNIPITRLDLIIIDEASMLSRALIREIKAFKKPGSKIIMIGDDAQLPPVGESEVSAVFNIKNSYTLTEKMRQAATSPIISIGEKVAKNGLSDSPVVRCLTKEDRVYKYDEESGSEVIFESDENKVLEMVSEDLKKANSNVNYCKMVTFNNHNHNNSQSVKSLNRKIRTKLWKDPSVQYHIGEMLTSYSSYSESELVKTKSKTFLKKRLLFDNSEDFIVSSVSDIEMKKLDLSHEQYNRSTNKTTCHKFTKSYECYYLTIVGAEDIDITYTVPVLTESSKLLFTSDMNELWKVSKKLCFDARGEFADLQYSYAITSHKAQGSSYVNTYVFEDNILGKSNAGSPEAKNQALYVAVSRPRKKLVILSSHNEKETVTPVNKVKKSKIFKINPEDYIKVTMLKKNKELDFIAGDGYKSINSIIEILKDRDNATKGIVSIVIEKENGDIKKLNKILK